jgi:hypothetical protein
MLWELGGLKLGAGRVVGVFEGEWEVRTGSLGDRHWKGMEVDWERLRGTGRDWE